MTDDTNNPDHIDYAAAIAECNRIQQIISEHSDRNMILWTAIELLDNGDLDENQQLIPRWGSNDTPIIQLLKNAGDEHPERAYVLNDERFIHRAATLIDQLKQLAAQRPRCDHHHNIYGYDHDEADDLITAENTLCCNDREGALLDELSNDARKTGAFAGLTYSLDDVLTA